MEWGWIVALWTGLAVFVPALVPLIVFAFYAVIVTRTNRLDEARASVAVHLEQRLDLVPGIIKLAARHMRHERTLLGEIVRLREEVVSAESPDLRQEASEALGREMGRLKLRLEAYPELRSDRTMLHAMETYNEVEARIAASRRFQNAAAASLNDATRIFPGSLIAYLMGVGRADTFKERAGAREPLDIDALMDGSERPRPVSATARF